MVMVVVMVEPVIRATEKFFIPVILFSCVLHALHHSNCFCRLCQQHNVARISHCVLAQTVSSHLFRVEMEAFLIL